MFTQSKCCHKLLSSFPGLNRNDPFFFSFFPSKKAGSFSFPKLFPAPLFKNLVLLLDFYPNFQMLEIEN